MAEEVGGSRSRRKKKKNGNAKLWKGDKVEVRRRRKECVCVLNTSKKLERERETEGEGFLLLFPFGLNFGGLFSLLAVFSFLVLLLLSNWFVLLQNSWKPLVVYLSHSFFLPSFLFFSLGCLPPFLWLIIVVFISFLMVYCCIAYHVFQFLSEIGRGLPALPFHL